MYTADRTVYRGTQWIATYADAQQAIEVPLAVPQDRLGDKAGVQVDTLNRLFDWVYDPHWTVDRLLHVQIVVTQALAETAMADRYQRLLSAPMLSTRLCNGTGNCLLPERWTHIATKYGR
jgi:hypothetical protein